VVDLPAKTKRERSMKTKKKCEQRKTREGGRVGEVSHCLVCRPHKQTNEGGGISGRMEGGKKCSKLERVLINFHFISTFNPIKCFVFVFKSCTIIHWNDWLLQQQQNKVLPCMCPSAGVLCVGFERRYVC